jgi:hypothetical protein
VNVKTRTTVILEMTTKEARFLKSYLSGRLGGDETQEIEEMIVRFVKNIPDFHAPGPWSLYKEDEN